MREEAALAVLPMYVIEMLGNAMNSRICAADTCSSSAALLLNNENQPHKRFRLYKDVQYSFAGKDCNRLSFVELGIVNVPYMQPDNMSPQQYADFYF